MDPYIKGMHSSSMWVAPEAVPLFPLVPPLPPLFDYLPTFSLHSSISPPLPRFSPHLHAFSLSFPPPFSPFSRPFPYLFVLFPPFPLFCPPFSLPYPPSSLPPIPSFSLPFLPVPRSTPPPLFLLSPPFPPFSPLPKYSYICPRGGISAGRTKLLLSMLLPILIHLCLPARMPCHACPTNPCQHSQRDNVIPLWRPSSVLRQFTG